MGVSTRHPSFSLFSHPIRVHSYIDIYRLFKKKKKTEEPRERRRLKREREREAEIVERESERRERKGGERNSILGNVYSLSFNVLMI